MSEKDDPVNISTDATTRREAARDRSSGEFGHQARTGPAGFDSDDEAMLAGEAAMAVDEDEYGDDYGCPACGLPGDYCQGHGEIGDPAGAKILDDHDNGEHRKCNAAGCDIADARMSELIDDRFVLSEIKVNADRYGETPQWNRSTGPFGWGDVNHVEESAPGVMGLSCSGHGGYKLSDVRNNDIPAALRNRSGWYEEDAESHIVAAYCPDVFADGKTRTIAEVEADGIAGVKNWFPDKYEAATGETIPLDQSFMKRDAALKADEAAYRAAHSHEFVGTGHTDGHSHQSWIPEGFTAVTARMDDTGEHRTFLVPEAESVRDGRFVTNVLVDPKRHVDVTSVAALGAYVKPPEPAKIHDVGYSTVGMTPAAAARAEKDMSKDYRWPDGFVGNTVQRLERDGAIGKSSYTDGNGRTQYRVELGSGYVMPVSKAGFESLAGLDDHTTDSSRANGDVIRAIKRADDLRANAWESYRKVGRVKHDEAVARADADVAMARIRYDRAVKAENDAAGILPHDQVQQMRARAFADLMLTEDQS